MAAQPKAIRRILAGTDFSRPASQAVLRAVMLAAEHSADLEIVHVAPRVDRARLRRLGLGGLAGACAGELCAARLAQAQDLAYSRGVTATVRLLKGGPRGADAGSCAPVR
ncbi:MAG TPA: universal stress protein [Myxococcota bacterium]|nr:universal stress protein [Myxococcota bacterium]